MADPVSLGTIALIGSTALSATGQVMAGREKAAAAAFEQQQLQQRADIARTAAMQDEARRREDLTSSLGTIDAIRAGRGLAPTSPTYSAITEDVIARGERDIRTSRINYLTQADTARMGAEMARRKEGYSLLAADLGAGATVAGAGFKAQRLYG